MPPIPDLELMSNKELAGLLREYGIGSGPIVDSTRKLYEKKLLQKITGKEIKSKYPPVPHDESDEDVAPSPAYKDQLDRSEPRRRGLRSGTPDNVEPLNESYRRSPRLNKTTPMKFTSTPLQKPGGKNQDTSINTSSSGGIPLWIKILLLIIAVVIGYLVFQNMESSEDNSIPRGITAEV